jgi:uncharacterized protein YdbL (DUF1318 family)
VKTKTLGTAACFTLAACVTVNVYFPAAEVKDLSRKIEEAVQKEAAKSKGDAAEPPQAPSSPDGSSGVRLFDLVVGVTVAHAQVASPEVTSPAIRKIIESRAARVAALEPHRASGVLGENQQGLLEVRKLDALSDLRARAEVQRLVKAENADREALYQEIAVTKKVDLSQLPKIRETYASTLRELAAPGTWIQMPGGEWKQK